MLPKLTLAIVAMSLSLVFATSGQNRKSASSGNTATPSEMKVQMDSIFIDLQNDLDEIVNSPAVKNKTAATTINGYFFKELKKNQVYYSLTKVSSKGILTNEVIRMVEKPNVKPVSLSKELWVKRTITARKPYWGLKKLEQTGRYYLIWAAPILSQDKKGKEVVSGAVALKIDLWDCFHKVANKSETPFLVRIDKMKLYSNKWENGVKYKEELLTVAGIKKISVRYPRVIETAVAPVVPSEPVVKDTTPAVDSSAIKAAKLDSVKAVQAVLEKKKAQKTNLIIIAILVLLALIVAFLFIVVPTIKQRRLLREIENSDDKL